MVRNGIFWTIGEQSYIVYYPIISYQKIRVYRVKKWISEDPNETKVLLGRFLISISRTVLIVRDKMTW